MGLQRMSECGDWPSEFVTRVIKAMAPARVCRTCGEPSRRIVKSDNATDDRRALADYLKEGRVAVGMTMKALAGYFPSVSGGVTGCVWNWENAANVPTAEQWPILKGLLSLDDRFDDLVTGKRTWTESLAEYEMLHSNGPKNQGRAVETAMGNLTTRANRIPVDGGFSDCGHDNWRPGLVLDPFGTGVTAEVAEALGREGIEIQLREDVNG